MSRNIFIIGNGFDLDLGWKTRFSDFANSEFWPKQDGIYIPGLLIHLESKKDKETWFDLENELLQYATGNFTDRPISRMGMDPRKDIPYFRKIHWALTEYLKVQQELPIKKDSVSAKVLNAICHNGYFKSNYSFN